jgi:hypothetical protein
MLGNLVIPHPWDVVMLVIMLAVLIAAVVFIRHRQQEMKDWKRKGGDADR